MIAYSLRSGRGGNSAEAAFKTPDDSVRIASVSSPSTPDDTGRLLIASLNSQEDGIDISRRPSESARAAIEPDDAARPGSFRWNQKPVQSPKQQACRRSPRMKTVVVTDQNQKWFEISDVTVLTARRYLADPENGNEGTVRVLNLCRTGRYQ